MFHPDHSDAVDRLEAERFYNAPDAPEPPWGDADYLEVEQDERERRGEFDEEIYPQTWTHRMMRDELSLNLCMFDVGGRPCIYPFGHDGDHRPMPTWDDVQ